MLTNRRGQAKTVFVAMIVVLVAWGPPVSAQEGKPVKISGSRYMFYNVTDFATSFLRNVPSAPDIVVSSDSSLIAFKKLLDGEIDAYMSFRKLDEDERLEAQERGINLMEHIVGYGAVAIVTNPANTVTELTVAQVRKLFSGEYLNWSQVGGPKMSVIPITRDESISGTELVFREIVLEGYPVAQHTIRQADHDISLSVRKEPGAIADARFTEALRGQKKRIGQDYRHQGARRRASHPPHGRNCQERYLHPRESPLHVLRCESHLHDSETVYGLLCGAWVGHSYFCYQGSQSKRIGYVAKRG